MKYSKKPAIKNKKVLILAIVSCIVIGIILIWAIWGKNASDKKDSQKKRKATVSIDWKNQSFCCYISGMEGKRVLSQKKVRYRDVNLLAVVNPKTHKILLVNTPRDTLLTVPKQAKKNAGKTEKLDAMPLYGKNAPKWALQELYDIKVDCSITVDYIALKQIVNELGGVSVYSECDFQSDWGPSFVKGQNQVNGEEALAFVRERHHLPEGDIQRGRNQQYLIQAIYEKLKEEKSLISYQKILSVLKKNVSTDLSMKSLQKLLQWQLEDESEWNITTTGITGQPLAAVTQSSEGEEIYVLELDEDSVEEIKTQIKEAMQ